MLKKKTSRTKHFKNASLLKALGHHCQKLRAQRGLSIDRLAKESDRLSASVVHRLESGSGAVTVSALFRYAEVLGVPPKDLLDFDPPQASRETSPRNLRLLDPDDPRVQTEAFHTLLPLLSIKAAAGNFGAVDRAEPEGWIDLGKAHRLDAKMFVVRAKGNSMLPKIRHGDYLVFRSDPTGSKQGRVVLAQYRGPADPDTGGSYTVKQYGSSKVVAGADDWRHRQITLSPTNPEYEPITLLPKDKDDFRIIAEYLFSL